MEKSQPSSHSSRVTVSANAFQEARPKAAVYTQSANAASATLASERVETALLWALIAGLAWAPLWLGGNRLVPWGVNAIVFPSLAIAYEISLLLRGRKHPFALKRILGAALLFAAALIWIGVQMSTLAPPFIAHPIWGLASDVLESPVAGSISVNRGATAIALVRLLTEASVFWLALQLSREPRRSLLVLQSVSWIVAAYAALGLILAAFFAGAIPPFEGPLAGTVRSTFVNRNNFATYAGLGLIATLGLTLRLYRHEVPDQAGIASYRLNRLLESTGRRGWSLVGSGLVILVALLASVSRGGILSAALGVFILLVLSFTRKRRRQTEQIEIILFVTLALAAGFLVFGDQIVGRIAASGLEDSSRASVYMITIRSILDAPLLGFGYGTFADVFPMYRDKSISTLGVWDKAHNTYLEVLQGLGVIFGGALIASLGLIVLQCFMGAIKRRRDATAPVVASAAALLVGLHSLVDFSLQIDAVAITFMALLGAGLAQAESSRHAVSD